MTVYEKALIRAVIAHKNQKRWNGDPYIVHPIRVAAKLKNPKAKVVALLHDTVEDKHLSLRQIANEFGLEIATAVDSVSRWGTEDYAEFILRAKKNNLGRIVKIADIEDNLPGTKPHLKDRYEKALKTLKEDDSQYIFPD